MISMVPIWRRGGRLSFWNGVTSCRADVPVRRPDLVVLHHGDGRLAHRYPGATTGSARWNQVVYLIPAIDKMVGFTPDALVTAAKGRMWRMKLARPEWIPELFGWHSLSFRNRVRGRRWEVADA